MESSNLKYWNVFVNELYVNPFDLQLKCSDS